MGKRFLVLNGPMLNMLGIREPEIYGQRTYRDLEQYIRDSAEALGVSVEVVQSNHEGALIDAIQAAYGIYDGIVLNAGGYTHTSVAILDALQAVALPVAEVHLSDIREREPFRQLSYPSMIALRCIAGKGFAGYREALELLVQHTA